MAQLLFDFQHLLPGTAVWHTLLNSYGTSCTALGRRFEH